MRPLKILYSYTGLTYDEGARYIHHLMQAMRAQGQVVEACCSLESALALALKADGFTVYEMPVAQGVTVVSQLLRWRKWLKQQNYDVVNNNAVEFSEHEASIDLREKLDLDTKTLLIATQVQLHKGSGALELIQATMQQQTERAYRGWLEQLR